MLPEAGLSNPTIERSNLEVKTTAQSTANSKTAAMMQVAAPEKKQTSESFDTCDEDTRVKARSKGSSHCVTIYDGELTAQVAHKTETQVDEKDTNKATTRTITTTKEFTRELD